ncbi:MAG: ATP-binding protein [Gammaproteobacteria bacterium]
MSLSLVTRVLVAAAAVMLVFLGLTVLALDAAFRNTAERAIEERLQMQVRALISAAGQDVDGHLIMPQQLPEARYSNPGSGLFAQVLDGDGNPLWRSPSTAGVAMLIPDEYAAGDVLFTRVSLGDEAEAFQYGYTVLWHDGPGDASPQIYHFSVAESLESYRAQLARYRANLFGWFSVLFAGLIVAQLLILRRTLRPLRALATEVAAVERGAQAGVDGEYPQELQHLARNLNAVIRNERGNLARYRNTLADLAHSLKTPLAVIRFALDTTGSKRDETIETQVERMNDIVRFQLQRALASGSETFGKPVPVASVVDDIAASLAKVYAARDIAFEASVPGDSVFRGDRNELLEVLGNLLDNAYKWARSRVRVTVTGDLEIVVDDDGPGIASDQRTAMQARGTRADESVEGQGIGLAVVAETVARRGGTLVLDESALGGLRVVVAYPARR